MYIEYETLEIQWKLDWLDLISSLYSLHSHCIRVLDANSSIPICMHSCRPAALVIQTVELNWNRKWFLGAEIMIHYIDYWMRTQAMDHLVQTFLNPFKCLNWNYFQQKYTKRCCAQCATNKYQTTFVQNCIRTAWINVIFVRCRWNVSKTTSCPRRITVRRNAVVVLWWHIQICVLNFCLRLWWRLVCIFDMNLVFICEQVEIFAVFYLFVSIVFQNVHKPCHVTRVDFGSVQLWYLRSSRGVHYVHLNGAVHVDIRIWNWFKSKRKLMYYWLLLLAANTLQLHTLHLQIECRCLQRIADHFR